MKKFQTILLLLCISICLSACNDDNTKTEPEKPADNGPTKVLIKTTLGDITVILYDETPQHRDNFIKLVNDGFYTDVLFHRIIKKFMIQAGDPDSKTAKPGQELGNGDLGYTIPAEFNANLFHKRGALAAARIGDNYNPTKASSASQFYIVDGNIYSDYQMNSMEKQMGITIPEEHRAVYRTIGGVPYLDGQYTVFGEVESGMGVVDSIASQPKDSKDRPLTDIKIISATIVK